MDIRGRLSANSGVNSMNRSLQINQIIAFFFILLMATIFVIVKAADSSASSLEVSLPDNSHDVEGLSSTELVPELTIRNTGDESVNVSIETKHPIGEETKGTVDIYPQIALGRKEQGQYHVVELDGEKQRTFTILIAVNDSSFADTYTFPVKVTNLDNTEEKHSFIVTIVVLPVNKIEIKLDDKEDEKTIRPGYSTQFYFRITNLGNIFQEQVTLDIDYEGNNLTAVVDPEEAVLNPVHSVMREEDAIRIFAVTIGAIEEKGDGIFEIRIYIETPDHDGDHHYTTVTLKVSSSVPPPIQPTAQSSSEDFPLPIFMGGMLVFIAAMGGIGKVFVLDKNDDEPDEGGWEDEGPAWEMEEESESRMIAEDFQMPLTSPPFQPPQGPVPPGPAKPDIPDNTDGQETFSFQNTEQASGSRTRAIQSPTRSSQRSQGEIHTPSQREVKQRNEKSGPIHVKCPGCRSGLKISNPKRPLSISCPKCSTRFTLKSKEIGTAPPMAARQKHEPAPAAKPTSGSVPRSHGPVHVKCPECSTGMKVSNPKRPLTISCPKCSSTFTIRGKAACTSKSPAKNMAQPSQNPQGPVHVKCPKCSTGMKVRNPKRPLTIPCPKCSAKFTLKGKGTRTASTISSKESSEPSTTNTSVSMQSFKPSSKDSNGSMGSSSSQGPATKKVQQISCPKCTTTFRVSNPARPLSVSCPQCRIKLNLK